MKSGILKGFYLHEMEDILGGDFWMGVSLKESIITHSKLRIINYTLKITHNKLHIINYTLHIMHYYLNISLILIRNVL